MKVQDIIVEDFINFKAPSMYIISAVCDWKCCIEQGLDINVCQNAALRFGRVKDISNETILDLYRSNDITQAIVIGGLEPFMQFDEMYELIRYFRSQGIYAPFVIYTGYTQTEIYTGIRRLKAYPNIIVKFGRYIPSLPARYDPVLGVMLASSNQFAVEISQA